MTHRITSRRPETGRIGRRFFAVSLTACVLVAPLLARADTATLTAAQDAWLDQTSGQQSVNHGSDALLNVKAGTSMLPKQRTLVQFDLSSVPACASVTSASLKLQIGSAPSSRTHAVHRLKKNWTEGGVTWLTTDGVTPWAGGGANDASDYNSTASATAATGTTSGATISWDVTADAAAFVAGTSPNYGWVIRDRNEGTATVLVTYDSKESTVPPTLEVTYTLTDANCDDGNVCTTDTCAPAGCQYANNSLPCSDGLFCNGDDTCDIVTGTCTLHTGDPCVGPDGDSDCAESCSEADDNCLAPDPDGTLCRDVAGPCDQAETCSSGVCPSDQFLTGDVCRSGSGDSCDPDETCSGSSPSCPPDTITSSGTVCRTGSGDDCDPDEACTGVAAAPCPADTITPSGTVCRTGSGDSCDPDEACTGTAGQACPTDSLAPTTTTCRAAADVCDAAENCPGTPGAACPADQKEPSGTECRPAANACDVSETCDGSSNSCPADVEKADGTSCSDGLYCNGAEVCMSGVCTDQAAPCAFVCDEPTDTCSDACPAGPQDCRSADKSLLKVKNNSDDTKDKLLWKFIKGESTTFEELSDPRDTADYTLCIYAGTADALVATINIPDNSSRWTVVGNNKGYKYFDSTGDADGVQKILLKAGSSGRTKAKIKARGAALPEILGPSGLAMPVTAQLLNQESGICWEGVYSGTAKKNTEKQFKAMQ